MQGLVENILSDLTERAKADSALINAGARAAELKLSPAIRNVNACYRKALQDPNVKIPTYLHGALEALAVLIPAPAPKEAWERDQSGHGDIGPSGAALRPGT